MALEPANLLILGKPIVEVSAPEGFTRFLVTTGSLMSAITILLF